MGDQAGGGVEGHRVEGRCRREVDLEESPVVAEQVGGRGPVPLEEFEADVIAADQ